ncbi:hypothetical protein ACFV6F_01655 [Kitasatospora phosalacinea]|uniref:hypothetical protein n=1 Tax=Kitasatospora phosalacinea TaxID=2065 RepID=UPI00365EFC9F
MRVRIPVTCTDGSFTVVTSVGTDGLLHGLRPDTYSGCPWRAPPYAHEDRFTERDTVEIIDAWGV